MNDLKFALRQLRKSLGFTAVVVLTSHLVTFAGVAAFRVVVALFAYYIAAHHVTLIDPIQALRTE